MCCNRETLSKFSRRILWQSKKARKKIFGYNRNTTRIQQSVSCQSGNTRVRKDKNKAWVNVTDDSLPKRKRKVTLHIELSIP